MSPSFALLRRSLIRIQPIPGKCGVNGQARVGRMTRQPQPQGMRGNNSDATQVAQSDQ